MNPIDISKLPYRQGVGLCVFNDKGQVLIAERRDRRGAWQMPQGGVGHGEDPRVTVLREMKEEVGTDKGQLIAQIRDKLSYEFPDWLQWKGGVFKGKYRGQEQLWFALRFTGTDADISLDGLDEDPEDPEFVDWRWEELKEVPRLIVEFKRPVYDAVVKAFTPLAEAIKRGETIDILRYPGLIA